MFLNQKGILAVGLHGCQGYCAWESLKNTLHYTFYRLQVESSILHAFALEAKTTVKEFRMAAEKSTIEVVCPRCKRTEIVNVPKEEIPKCQDCNIRMVFREVLREGKSY